MTSPYAIHWFRRDLRVTGNPALQKSWNDSQARVVGLFSFDSRFLARPDFSKNRFAFFLSSLRTLRDELRSLGSDLLVLDIGPDEAFRMIFETLKSKKIPFPSSVSFNRDYEPFARDRDTRITDLLRKEFGVSTHSERDHLLLEPHEVLKDNGTFYQVYSPFAKKWFDKFSTPEVQSRIQTQKKALSSLSKRSSEDKPFSLTWKKLFGEPVPFEDALDFYIEKNTSTVPLPEPGTLAAFTKAKKFLSNSVDQYAEKRDFPDQEGTSRLSIYFKNGSLTSSQVLAMLEPDRPNPKAKDGRTIFLKELVWREFYYHILYHSPNVENESFLPHYRDLKWENNEKWFAAWKAGQTGYPIIDAGMRQLNTTGWMHNRVRMIVASFLTKDLLIDWRWGERYFMEKLLDGDLAPNNGGWQWAASTGCDPQPYFRIFNPKLQSEKFDPNGKYIKSFISELSDCPIEYIHTPHEAPVSTSYPEPIVDHAEQKLRALRLYDRTS